MDRWIKDGRISHRTTACIATETILERNKSKEGTSQWGRRGANMMENLGNRRHVHRQRLWLVRAAFILSLAGAVCPFCAAPSQRAREADRERGRSTHSPPTQRQISFIHFLTSLSFLPAPSLLHHTPPRPPPLSSLSCPRPLGRLPSSRTAFLLPLCTRPHRNNRLLLGQSRLSLPILLLL